MGMDPLGQTVSIQIVHMNAWQNPNSLRSISPHETEDVRANLSSPEEIDRAKLLGEMWTDLELVGGCTRVHTETDCLALPRGAITYLSRAMSVDRAALPRMFFRVVNPMGPLSNFGCVREYFSKKLLTNPDGSHCGEFRRNPRHHDEFWNQARRPQGDASSTKLCSRASRYGIIRVPRLPQQVLGAMGMNSRVAPYPDFQ
jgi:hypothetical protein